MSLLYGIHKATLEAYVRAERKKVYEEVAREAAMRAMTIGEKGLCGLSPLDHFVAMADWCIAQAAKETHDASVE